MVLKKIDIWQKCPKTAEILALEKKVQVFLVRYQLSAYFTVEQIENWIYLCPAQKENEVFNPILARMKNRTLKDLAAFDALFREQFFPQIPQKILNDLSPVRYALFLKRLNE